MLKNIIIRKTIMDLLSDNKLHSIRECSMYIRKFNNLENIEISKSAISYNISYLCKHNIIEKYGRFIRIK